MIKTISEESAEEGTATEQKILILITSDRIGQGDDTLGKKLMTNYIRSLKEMGSDLWQIVFVNGGVHLVTEVSEVISDLKAYQDDKVTILSCGTCLEHFGLTEKKAVGETTNMLDIVTGLQYADKVITVS